MRTSFLNINSIVICMCLHTLFGHGQAATFNNPIVSGAYPDPSIIKVGNDFYLSNSSFEYFPGVPIWHSKDLVHWNNIGFGIHRAEQFNFDGIASSAGAWAGTLRENKGIYYLPLTWVDWRMKVGFKNVILTATNPVGPWSNPYIITDTIWGIDPSLFFDEDGKAYWLMNHPAVGFKHEGAASIMIQEIDLTTMKLKGNASFIGRGAMLDSKYPEGPKMYKKDGYYYLVIAEGGTGQFHSVTISRSKNIIGTYENYEGNPLLTHRALGYTSPIINTGHADMVQTAADQWWMVCLGSRPLAGKNNILGRETFLVPVKWNKGEWPICSPGFGQVKGVETAPELPFFETKQPIVKDEFNDSTLSNEWTFIRTPSSFYSLDTKKGTLELKLLPQKLSQICSPAFIGKRLKYRSGSITTELLFESKKKNEEVGLVLYKSEKAFLKYILSDRQLKISIQKDSVETVLYAEQIATSLPIQLSIKQEEDVFSFAYKLANGKWNNVLDNWNGNLLSVEQSGGFMGAFVGLYATSNGVNSNARAFFNWFEYKPKID